MLVVAVVALVDFYSSTLFFVRLSVSFVAESLLNFLLFDRLLLFFSLYSLSLLSKPIDVKMSKA